MVRIFKFYATWQKAYHISATYKHVVCSKEITMDQENENPTYTSSTWYV